MVVREECWDGTAWLGVENGLSFSHVQRAGLLATSYTQKEVQGSVFAQLYPFLVKSVYLKHTKYN